MASLTLIGRDDDGEVLKLYASDGVRCAACSGATKSGLRAYHLVTETRDEITILCHYCAPVILAILNGWTPDWLESPENRKSP
jgi:hypothetical protein